MRAEWTKLRTLHSTTWLLLGAIVATAGVSAAIISSIQCPVAATCVEDIPKLSLSGVRLGQILIAVFAALAVTNEYGTNMMQTTLLTRPQRWRVAVGKLVVVTAITLAVSAAAVAVSLIASGKILTGHGISVRATIGSVLYLGLIAVLSMGLGLVFRDTAGAIVAVFTFLFVAPLAAMFVTNPTWHHRLEKFGPMSAGLSIQATKGLASLHVQPWPGLGILAAYAFGAAALGTIMFYLRDA